MAYDEGLAQRVREILEEQPGFDEKKMFGGICFLLHGNMACGVLNDAIIVRVGIENYESFLNLSHVKKFDYTGRPMKGWVVVLDGGIESDDDLYTWVRRGEDYALSLSPK